MDALPRDALLRDPPGIWRALAAVKFTVPKNFLAPIAKFGQGDLSNVALVRWLFVLDPQTRPEPPKILSENLIWRPGGGVRKLTSIRYKS
jgi:hypothetical protein